MPSSDKVKRRQSSKLYVSLRELAIFVAMLPEPGFVSILDTVAFTMVVTPDSKFVFRPVGEMMCVIG